MLMAERTDVNITGEHSLMYASLSGDGIILSMMLVKEPRLLHGDH